MGGKTWSDEEERYFWRILVPLSPLAADPASRRLTWSMCATNMQQTMGEPRRRTYTRTMLYEHYYQNIKTGNHSPRARDFVLEHLRDIKSFTEHDDKAVKVISEAEAVSSQDDRDLTNIAKPSPDRLSSALPEPLDLVTYTRKHGRSSGAYRHMAKRQRGPPANLHLRPQHSASNVQMIDKSQTKRYPIPTAPLSPMIPYPVHVHSSSAFLNIVCNPVDPAPEITDKMRTPLSSERLISPRVNKPQCSTVSSGITSPLFVELSAQDRFLW